SSGGSRWCSSAGGCCAIARSPDPGPARTGPGVNDRALPPEAAPPAVVATGPAGEAVTPAAPAGEPVAAAAPAGEPVAAAPGRTARASLAVLALVAVAVALSLGQALFLPIVLAVLLTLLLTPAVDLADRLGLPRWLGALLVVAG